MATDAEINAAWQASAKAVNVGISDESTGAPAAGGLKFFAAAPTGTSYAGTSVVLNWTLADLQAATFTTSAKEQTLSVEKTFYYGIKGVDGTTDDATVSYVIGATAANA